MNKQEMSNEVMRIGVLLDQIGRLAMIAEGETYESSAQACMAGVRSMAAEAHEISEIIERAVVQEKSSTAGTQISSVGDIVQT